MQFVNLTDHNIALNNGTVFPPSGQIARVATGYSDFDADGICAAIFGGVTGLPDSQPETMYIVSGMVAAAVAAANAAHNADEYHTTGGMVRWDVVSPATGHPDARRENGQIISVPGFIQA